MSTGPLRRDRGRTPRHGFTPRRGLAARRNLAAVTVTAFMLASIAVVAPAAIADGPTSFSATGAITVPGQDYMEDLQPASPYPSTVAVSGMSGVIEKVEVTLHGVTHTVMNDMDVLLVSPDGSNLVVLSDAGGMGSLAWATGADLRFSDTGSALPSSGQITTGTYTSFNSNVNETPADTFAPGGGPSPHSSHTTFADAFGGNEPNGTWSLYVIDDTNGDTGSIAGGWTLTLTTGTTSQPGLLAFSSSEYRGVESDGTIDVTIQRTAGSDGAVSATLTTTNGSAVAGTHFTAPPTTVSFTEGQTTAVVSIPVIDDSDPGPDRDFTVTLSNPTDGAALGSQQTARVVVENDDGSSNPTGIQVPTAGAANPYPSNIYLSGLGSYVTDVNVTLTNIGHTSPADLDVLLVGPQGQSVVLLSDVGNFSEITNVTLTFDDAAPGPVTVPSVTGTYRPTDNDLDGDGSIIPDAPMPAPAPAEPYGTALDVFNGTDPNGTWMLFVVDDATGDAGSIGGWSLDVATATFDSGGPYTINEGSPLSLNASSNVAEASYAWDLDDDGEFDDATGATPSISVDTLTGFGFADGPATANIHLQVTSGALSLTESTTLTVTNVAPTGTLSNDGPVLIGETATLTLADLADPSAADVTAGLTYEIDWDGDTVIDASGNWTTGDEDPTVTIPASALATTGTQPFTVTLSDKDGGTTSMSTSVTVDATIPTATFANSGPVAEGGPASVTFTNPVDAAPGAILTYSYDFDGDGVFDVVDSADSTSEVPEALTDDGPATVTVTGRISNQYGGSSDYSTNISVTNVAPSGELTNDGPILIGETATLTLINLTDPSSADVADGLEYEIDWDGNAVIDASGSWTTGDPDPTITLPATVLPTIGTHPFTVTLSDKDGGTTPLSTDVVVAPTLPTATLSNSGPIQEGETATVTFSDQLDPGPT